MKYYAFNHYSYCYWRSLRRFMAFCYINRWHQFTENIEHLYLWLVRKWMTECIMNDGFPQNRIYKLSWNAIVSDIQSKFISFIGSSFSMEIMNNLVNEAELWLSLDIHLPSIPSVKNSFDSIGFSSTQYPTFNLVYTNIIKYSNKIFIIERTKSFRRNSFDIFHQTMMTSIYSYRSKRKNPKRNLFQLEHYYHKSSISNTFLCWLFFRFFCSFVHTWLLVSFDFHLDFYIPLLS